MWCGRGARAAPRVVSGCFVGPSPSPRPPARPTGLRGLSDTVPSVPNERPHALSDALSCPGEALRIGSRCGPGFDSPGLLAVSAASRVRALHLSCFTRVYPSLIAVAYSRNSHFNSTCATALRPMAMVSNHCVRGLSMFFWSGSAQCRPHAWARSGPRTEPGPRVMAATIRGAGWRVRCE